MLHSLGPAVGVALEALMAGGRYEFQSEFARRYFNEGLAAGRAEGLAKALLEVLARRGLIPTGHQHQLITSCTDAKTLDRWIERSLDVSSVDELLG